MVGGDQNTATCKYAAVVSGKVNRVMANYGFIGSGHNNTLSAAHAHSSILGTGLQSVSANMLHAALLALSGIPTSDPGVDGVVWRDGTDLKISV